MFDRMSLPEICHSMPEFHILDRRTGYVEFPGTSQRVRSGGGRAYRQNLLV
ncbi:hypothetical protein PCAR4_350085 [Paraburkholderia caribensis]|nr:hypothetical protein PCAR4_350085 [Paraburkholderia caribensis]